MINITTMMIPSGPDQFAYKKGHNTTMALIKCQNVWLEQFDIGADCAKAFSLILLRRFGTLPSGTAQKNSAV